MMYLVCTSAAFWFGFPANPVSRPVTGIGQPRQYYVAALEDPAGVDQRRSEIGLGPLEEYLRNWGITWNKALETGGGLVDLVPFENGAGPSNSLRPSAATCPTNVGPLRFTNRVR